MFSVIIPNYNNEKYLDELFESIISQTFKNYEIIFIDDVSEDNSIQKAKEWKEKISHVDLVSLVLILQFRVMFEITE